MYSKTKLLDNILCRKKQQGESWRGRKKSPAKSTPSYLRTFSLWGAFLIHWCSTFDHSARHEPAIPGFPVLISRVSSKNWSFQGLSEANSCDFLPRVFRKNLPRGFQIWQQFPKPAKLTVPSQLGCSLYVPLYPSTYLTNWKVLVIYFSLSFSIS